MAFKQESVFWQEIRDSQFMINKMPTRIECKYPAGIPDILFKWPGGYLDFLEIKVVKSNGINLKVQHISAEQAEFSEKFNTFILVKIFLKNNVVYVGTKCPDKITRFRYEGVPFNELTVYNNVEDLLRGIYKKCQ